MDKYAEIECRLAEVLGYKTGCGENTDGAKILLTVVDGKFIELPRWARDNAAAFELMVEHEVMLEYYDDQVYAYADIDGIGLNWEVCKYESHPNKQAAVRFAIISAVVDKLEAE